MRGFKIDRGAAIDWIALISVRLGWVSEHTALLFPVPGLRLSRPPGPMLLLLALRLAASSLATSTVAFSLSIVFRLPCCAPIDFLARLVAGTVASLGEDMLTTLSRDDRLRTRWTMGVNGQQNSWIAITV